MKKVSVEFREVGYTVIDYEMSDEDYESYKGGEKNLTDILGEDIFEDASNKLCGGNGGWGMSGDVIMVENI